MCPDDDFDCPDELSIVARRKINVFSMSFLDCICCGFGAIILLLVLAFVLRKIVEWLSVRRRRKAWLRALEDLIREYDPVLHPHEYLADLNRLFRAVAVKAFPGTACARLQGEEWVAFIASLMPEGSADKMGALASGPYEPLPSFEAASLNASASTWVNLYG